MAERPRLFTREWCVDNQRCPECEWHPKTMGHAPHCVTWDTKEESK